MMKSRLLLSVSAAMLAAHVSAAELTAEGGRFYIRNVGSQLFWGAGQSGGVKATLAAEPMYVMLTPFTDEGSNTLYTMQGMIDCGEGKCYFDGSNMNGATPAHLTITQSGNYYTIQLGNAYFGYDDATMVFCQTTILDNDTAWELLSEEELFAQQAEKLSSATKDAPVDATYLIANPDFGRYRVDTPIWNASSQTADMGESLMLGGPDADVSNYCAESTHAEFSVSQVLSRAPIGVYKLKAQGFYRADDDDTGCRPVFFANDSTAPFAEFTGGEADLSAAAAAFQSGDYTIDSIFVEVTAVGNLTIGARLEGNTHLWCAFDHFQLSYYGAEVTVQELMFGPIMAKYAEAVGEAKSMLEQKMGQDEESALARTIQTYANQEFATKEAYQEAIDQLTAATTQAAVSVALYARVYNAMERARTLVATMDRGGQATFNLSEVQEAYDRQLVFDFNYQDYLEKVEWALVVATKAQSTPGADMTPALINPSFETGTTRGWSYTIGGDYGAKPVSDEAYTMSNTDGDYLFYISPNGNTISQTVTGLPYGIYTLQAVVATSTGQQLRLSGNSQTTLVKGKGMETGVNGEVQFQVLDGTAVISLEGVYNSQYKADNFRLTFLNAIDLSEFQSAYADALHEAKAVTGYMNASVQSSLTEAINTYVDENDQVSLRTATVTLQSNTEAATACVAAYAAAKTAIDRANQVLAANNVATESAIDEFRQAIETYETRYDNGTLTTEAADGASLALGSVPTGYQEAGESAAAVFMSSAWNNMGPDDWENYYVNTWSTEGESDGSGFIVPFLEYYTYSNTNLPSNAMTATVSGLKPFGEYTVSLQARVEQRRSNTKVDNSILLTVGTKDSDREGAPTDLTQGKYVGITDYETTYYVGNYSATGKADARGDLEINIAVLTYSNICSFGFRNITYAEVPPVTPGDANGDNLIDLADVQAVVAHLLGQAPEGFTERGADANEDGRVDIADVTTIITKVMAGE